MSRADENCVKIVTHKISFDVILIPIINYKCYKDWNAECCFAQLQKTANSQKVVIEKKSAESMSFPLSVMVCAQCIMWWWYGYLIDDFFVQVRLGFHFCGIITIIWSFFSYPISANYTNFYFKFSQYLLFMILFLPQFPNICGTMLAFVQIGVILKFWDNKPKTVSSVMDTV